MDHAVLSVEALSTLQQAALSQVAHGRSVGSSRRGVSSHSTTYTPRCCYVVMSAVLWCSPRLALDLPAAGSFVIGRRTIYRDPQAMLVNCIQQCHFPSCVIGKDELHSSCVQAEPRLDLTSDASSRRAGPPWLPHLLQLPTSSHASLQISFNLLTAISKIHIEMPRRPGGGHDDCC